MTSRITAPRFSVKPETQHRRWDRQRLTPTPPATLLYRALDPAGQLLYIGITANPVERWRRHAQKSPWWTLVHHLQCETQPREVQALAAERHAIRDERPIFNRRSAGRVGLCTGLCVRCSIEKGARV